MKTRTEEQWRKPDKVFVGFEWKTILHSQQRKKIRLHREKFLLGKQTEKFWLWLLVHRISIYTNTLFLRKHLLWYPRRKHNCTASKLLLCNRSNEHNLRVIWLKLFQRPHLTYKKILLSKHILSKDFFELWCSKSWNKVCAKASKRNW